MNPIVCSCLVVFCSCLFISDILSGNSLKNQEGLTFEFQFVGKGSKLQGTFESIVSKGKKVKKEELHFKPKVKDMEPNHEKEEKMIKSVEKEKLKRRKDKGQKHKEKDEEKHEDSEIGEMNNKEENKENMHKDEEGDENT
ncbi:hypothetical protein J1N35_005539 [Gossypium stocksii]|uniref:Uncharacterized protein n=1 Tax=Gossypium stocksii TaxID=47602 RepID=A0A9D3WE05_9ROSI|nr:hypothetical protein J1N35_005539 [Gossypium stocksii]